MNSLLAVFARAGDVSSGDVVFWLGVLIIAGCLIAAALAARVGNWIATGLLAFVALIAGVLLL